MADKAQIAKPRTIPPLRLDPTTIRRSLEISPSRSSVHSSRTHTPPSSVPSTPVIHARPASPDKKPLHAGESNAFLTALAAQERRVFELKEELQKAEEVLEKLKKQWATHEATKKRNELRHLEQLQPLKTSMGGSPVESGEDDANIAGRDLDRWKMPPPMVKPSRTVFSGSRHTRALSLLSPKDSTAGGPHLPSPIYGPPRPHRFSINKDAIPNTIHESSNSTDGPSDLDGLYRGPSKDMLLETGKQVVGDFKQGLWTFFGDLRQVTVGDEAASTSDLRNQHPMLAGNMPKAQVKKERGLVVKGSLAGKADVSSADLGKSRPRKSVDARPRSDLSAQTDKSADIGPPSTLAEEIRTSNPNSNSSESDDDDGWDNWDTVTMKGSLARSLKNRERAL